MRTSLDLAFDEAGLLEHAQVSRHSRLCDAEVSRRLRDRSRSECEALDDAPPQGMGKVMSLVMPQVKGRADGKRVSAAVKEMLTP